MINCLINIEFSEFLIDFFLKKGYNSHKSKGESI